MAPSRVSSQGGSNSLEAAVPHTPLKKTNAGVKKATPKRPAGRPKKTPNPEHINQLYRHFEEHGQQPVNGTPKSQAERYANWDFNHTPPNAQSRIQNGRLHRRSLVPWGKPCMVEKLMLITRYECEIRGIDLPWDAIAHRLWPGATSTAVLQFCDRKRKEVIAQGHLVPPKPGRKMSNLNPLVRGHIRKYPEDPNNILETREVLFTEPLEEPDFADPTGYSLVHNKAMSAEGKTRKPVTTSQEESDPCHNSDSESDDEEQESNADERQWDAEHHIQRRPGTSRSMASSQDTLGHSNETKDGSHLYAGGINAAHNGEPHHTRPQRAQEEHRGPRVYQFAQAHQSTRALVGASQPFDGLSSGHAQRTTQPGVLPAGSHGNQDTFVYLENGVAYLDDQNQWKVITDPSWNAGGQEHVHQPSLANPSLLSGSGLSTTSSVSSSRRSSTAAYQNGFAGHQDHHSSGFDSQRSGISSQNGMETVPTASTPQDHQRPATSAPNHVTHDSGIKDGIVWSDWVDFASHQDAAPAQP